MKSKITRGGSIIPTGQFFDLAGDHVKRYVWVSEFAKGKRLLDAGCGHGYGSRYLLDSGASYVLGIDSDPDAIRFAIESYGLPNCEFKVLDVTKLDVEPVLFDLVVSFEVIEHIVDAGAYFRGISQVLRNGGLFVLSTPNKHYTIPSYENGRNPNPFHVREYYPQELVDLLKPNFSIDGMYVQFDKTLSDTEREKLYKTHAYVSKCNIPKSFRRAIPRPVKNLWLRRKRLSSMDSGNKKWTDYEIQRVENTKEIDARFENVLLSCRKM